MSTVTGKVVSIVLTIQDGDGKPFEVIIKSKGDLILETTAGVQGNVATQDDAPLQEPNDVVSVASSSAQASSSGTDFDFDEVPGESASNPTMAYIKTCLLYTSPSPRDQRGSRMPSSA